MGSRATEQIFEPPPLTAEYHVFESRRTLESVSTTSGRAEYREQQWPANRREGIRGRVSVLVSVLESNYEMLMNTRLSLLRTPAQSISATWMRPSCSLFS